MLEQVIKNIAERAENRNGLGSASSKSCVGKCNLGSMEEGRDLDHWQCIICCGKGSFSNYKLNVYVMGSIPILQAI